MTRLRHAAALAINPAAVTILPIDLGVERSVRGFVEVFQTLGLPPHALDCHAAVYLPRLETSNVHSRVTPYQKHIASRRNSPASG